MKINFTLFTFLMAIMSLNSSAQTVWENFDDAALASYFFTNGGLNQNFANPSTGGINSSALCGEYVRANVPFDVIVMDPIGIDAVEDCSAYVDGSKTMSMKVYSPAAGTQIQITLENATLAQPDNFPTGRHSEYLTTTTTSGEWEEVTFTFSNQPDPGVSDLAINRLVILFAPNTTGTDTYLWDDLMGPEFDNPCDGVEPDLNILEDFECQRNVTYEFSNGNLIGNIDNPSTGGANTSATCGSFTKFPGDGAFGGDFEGVVSSADVEAISIDLLGNEGPIDFFVILQNALQSNLLEVTFTSSGNGEWETFSTGLSGISPSEEIDRVVLLLDPGQVSGTEEPTIFFDNLKFETSFEDPCEGIDPVLSIFDDFECQRNMSYDFQNGTLLSALNPSSDGVNSSTSCGQFTKFPGDGAFGGGLDGTFSSAQFDQVSIDLLANNGPTDFLVIFQNNATPAVDLFEVTFSSAGDGNWQTFTADISAISPSEEIANVVLLLNPASEEEETIFYDNFMVEVADNINEAAGLELSVFPNPFINEIEISAETSISSISIIDMVGKTVFSQDVNNVSKFTVDTSNLTSGNYILSVQTTDGDIITKKLVK